MKSFTPPLPSVLPDDPALEDALLRDFDRFSARASVSSGVEVSANEVIVLGHSARWQGPLRMGCAPMRDALDIAAVGEALARAEMEEALATIARLAPKSELVGDFPKLAPGAIRQISPMSVAFRR